MESAVARAEFDEVWSVLQAMQEQDEVLDDLIHALQAERRRTKVTQQLEAASTVFENGPIFCG